jgi:hypothetical protein
MAQENPMKSPKNEEKSPKNEGDSEKKINAPPAPKLPGSVPAPPAPKLPGSIPVPPVPKLPGSIPAPKPGKASNSDSAKSFKKTSKGSENTPNLPPRKFGTPRNPDYSRNVNKFAKYKKPAESEVKPSAKDIDLSIPPIPEPKKIKVELKLKDEPMRKDTPETKWILIDCEMCGDKVIQMPVPRDYILKSPLPVTEVGYIHGDPQHCIVAQLDRDFEVRRRRCCKITFEKDYAKT